MSPLPQSHAHLQYASNYYQRKVNQSNYTVVQNPVNFDEEKFLESGKFVGLLRAIFTAIMTMDISPFCEFVAGFDARVNADNFKAVLKECVTDQQERDAIDALSASQLVELRDVVVLLEENRDGIIRTLGSDVWSSTTNDESYYSICGDYYTTGALKIRISYGIELYVGGSHYDLISCEQFVIQSDLSSTLDAIDMISDVDIARELIESVIRRFNALVASRSKVESPEIIAKTEELRLRILSKVSGRSVYNSSRLIRDFMIEAVLKQAVFGYSQGYLIERDAV